MKPHQHNAATQREIFAKTSKSGAAEGKLITHIMASHPELTRKLLREARNGGLPGYSQTYLSDCHEYDHEPDPQLKGCGSRALFVVSEPAEEVASRVCEEHLAEACRAANVDFGYEGAVVMLLNHNAGFGCEWVSDGNGYAQAVEEHPPPAMIMPEDIKEGQKP